MTVVIISKTNWNIQTVRNVESITLSSGGSYTIVGDTTVTVSKTTHIIRIMES